MAVTLSMPLTGVGHPLMGCARCAHQAPSHSPELVPGPAISHEPLCGQVSSAGFSCDWFLNLRRPCPSSPSPLISWVQQGVQL